MTMTNITWKPDFTKPNPYEGKIIENAKGIQELVIALVVYIGKMRLVQIETYSLACGFSGPQVVPLKSRSG